MPSVIHSRESIHPPLPFFTPTPHQPHTFWSPGLLPAESAQFCCLGTPRSVMIVERNGSRELGIRILELSLPLTSNLTLSKSLFLLQHFLELSGWIRCSVRSLPTLNVLFKYNSIPQVISLHIHQEAQAQ